MVGWDHPEFTVSLKFNGCCPYKRKEWEFWDTETHKGMKAIWRWRQRLRWCSYKRRNTQGCWHPPAFRREAWKRFFLRASKKEPHLLTFWFSTSGLWNQERIDFCFKLPSLGQFVAAAALGNKYRTVWGFETSDPESLILYWGGPTACPGLHGRCAAELRWEYLSTDPKLSVPPIPTHDLL